MYDSITGIIIRKYPGGVVISAGGIGYRLGVPERTLKTLSENNDLTLYSHLAVKDDSLKLFGFETSFERDLFLKIMSVSGIGAATALNLLSQIPPQRFLQAVAKENITLLQSVKGVGARTAKRLVVELMGKLEWAGLTPDGMDQPAPGEEALPSEPSRDLTAALLALGYPKSTVQEAADRAMKSCSDTDNLETLIKAALRSL